LKKNIINGWRKNMRFFGANYIGPETMIRHIAEHENNSKSHRNFCRISACFQLRILSTLRYRNRAFLKMAGSHDVSEGSHTDRKYTGY
jgi:hypothetical protein